MSGKEKRGLSEWAATAICGNDITSSCLYVSALSILYAGQWAWVSLLMVSVVLYFYRSIYGEVVGALPLNGGAYNALLNTTSKFVASLAACFTLLSYMATAVISANEAMHYLQTLCQSLLVMTATIVLLAVFMALTIRGIGESAKVATVIFILHLTTMGILILSAVWVLVNNGLHVFFENFHMPVEGSLTMALFFGFSAAMLGISGFESSANFVEEQKPGVFSKTLRNMWVAVFAALLGNIFMNPVYVGIFLEYFLPTVIIVLIMLNRIVLLTACLFFIQAVTKKLTWLSEILSRVIQIKIEDINSQQVVFFTRGGDLSNLNLALRSFKNSRKSGISQLILCLSVLPMVTLPIV